MEGRLLLATIVVTGTGDTIADDGIVTLREAITAANTNAASGDAAAGDDGLDTIAFDIPGDDVQTITVQSQLPTITDPVTIDGYTQHGASANTLETGNDAVLRIEVVGPGSGGNINGFTFAAGDSTLRGLVLNRFTNGIIADSDRNGDRRQRLRRRLTGRATLGVGDVHVLRHPDLLGGGQYRRRHVGRGEERRVGQHQPKHHRGPRFRGPILPIGDDDPG